MTNPYLDEYNPNWRKRKAAATPVAAPAPQPARNPYLDDYDPSWRKSASTTTQEEKPGFFSRLGSLAEQLAPSAARDLVQMSPLSLLPPVQKKLDDRYKDAGSERLALTKTLATGIKDDAKTLGNMAVDVALNRDDTVERLYNQSGGDRTKFAATVASPLSLLLGPAGRAAGLGPKMVTGLDAVMSAGIGAGLTPEDPLVGGTFAAAASLLPEVPGAARATGRGATKVAQATLAPRMDLGGVSDGVTQGLEPQIPSRLWREPREKIPAMSPEDRSEIANVIGKVFDKVAKGQPEVLPVSVARPVRRRSTADVSSVTDGAGAIEDARRALSQPEATPMESLGFGPDGTYSAGGELAGELAPGFVGRRPAEAVDARMPERAPGTLPPDRGAVSRPEDARYRAPVSGQTDRAIGELFPLEAVAELADRDLLIRQAADAATVQPAGPVAPRSPVAFPEGYGTARRTADIEAVPQPDGTARVFGQRDGAQGAVASPDGGSAAGRGATPDLTPDVVEGALDDYFGKLQQVKMNRGRLEMLNQEFQRFTEAFRATGDINAAMQAIESNAARGQIKVALGQKKTPKVDPSKAVDPTTPGIQPVKGGKTVDYRSWTQDQLEAEIRAKQDLIERGMEEFQASAYTRDTGDGYAASGFADGRGLGWAKQATRMMEAAERELAVRLRNAGFSEEEIAARIGEVRTVRNPDRVGVRVFTGESLPDEAFVGRNPDIEAQNIADEATPDLVPGNTGPGLGTMDEGVRGSRTVDAPVSRGLVPPEPVLNTPEQVDRALASIRQRQEMRDVPAGETAVGNAVSDGAPTLAPASKNYLNFRTILDVKDTPLALSTKTRIATAMQTNPDALKEARGYASLDEQQRAAMTSKRIREIIDDPLAIDSKQLKNLTGAQVVAVKEVLDENVRMQELLSREIVDGNLQGPDLDLAIERLQQLDVSNQEALKTIVGESARMGRDLGYLRVVARASTDPAVWMIQAQKRLGDVPMTDQMRDSIIRLANEAKEACG